ncbi:FkbM family methyltransferase [Falsirhodobacter algicola]|uniref:FkbM family methyltransferase n=1 Tax=Falsirhodobacter algicola TaxID=2692330 RepID=A0A8J8MTE9_9RHOB|nr:FkbM family methyltransferase [Falsirhodobacter algicola]QUS36159.1 FkbM family methyltransferase [Falsirhodobacter algicola]
MMLRTRIILRTNKFDERVAEAARTFGALPGYAFGIVVDETQGPVDIPAPYQKAAFDAGFIRRNRLSHPPMVGWRCGDYFYYAALKAWDDWDQLWMLEPDVAVHDADPSAPLRYLDEAAADVDFLCSAFRKTTPAWHWHASMEPYVPEVYGCFFPVTRINRRAADHLMKARIALSRRLPAKAMVPNDEAAAASLLKAGGFRCANLGEFGRSFTDKETFSSSGFITPRMLAQRPYDGRFYHAICDGNHLATRLTKAFDKARTDADVRRLHAIALTGDDSASPRLTEITARLRAALKDRREEMPHALDGRLMTLQGRSLTHLFAEEGDYIQNLQRSRRAFYEEGHLRKIERLLPTRRRRFVDVGAHTGNHTLFFLNEAGFETATVFEPMPRTRKSLLLNLSINGLRDRVDLRHCDHALGRAAGRGRAVFNAANWGASSVVPLEDGAAEGLPIVSLDSIAPGDPVDLVKIDLRSVLAVLEGMEALLARDRPSLLLTVWEDERDAVRDRLEPTHEIAYTEQQYPRQTLMLLRPRS